MKLTPGLLRHYTALIYIRENDIFCSSLHDIRSASFYILQGYFAVLDVNEINWISFLAINSLFGQNEE